METRPPVLCKQACKLFRGSGIVVLEARIREAIFSFAYGQSTNDSVVFRSPLQIPLQVSAAQFAPHMSPRLALLLLGILLTLSPSGNAQISAGVGVAYHDFEDAGRWGISGAVYIPLGGYAFDAVPNIEYYNSQWSRTGSGVATDTSDVYAISADGK